MKESKLTITRRYSIQLGEDQSQIRARCFSDVSSLRIDHYNGLQRIQVKDDFPHKILETGRYEKQFRTLTILKDTGSEVVYKAKHKLEKKVYAIKRVYVHLEHSADLEHQLKAH